jgi:hypothetical protein
VSPLLEGLSGWSGRKPLQAALEAHGFLIPQVWQGRVIDHCGAEFSDVISRYWDEIAKECVCSAGLANSRARKCRGETTYRSAYLDDLASSVDYAEPPFHEPELLRCLYDFERRAYFDKAFALGLTALIEEKKADEVRAIDVSPAGWTGGKRDAQAIFNQLAGSHGFGPTGRRFAKETQSGLRFVCWVDLGGRRSDCGVSLPLQLYIFHKTAPEVAFEVSSLGRIVPGFDYYGYFESPETAVLGMRAYLTLFDLLFHSVDGG